MIVVVENIVSKKNQEKIKKSIFTKSFPWYVGDLGLHHEFKHTIKDGAIWKEIVDDNTRSNFTEMALPIIRKASEEGKFKYNTIDFATAFLKVPTSAKDNLPHIYTKEKHIVVQYFVNDSDGDIIVYDKKWKSGMKKQLPLPESLIEKRITPKQGTAVIYTGHQYHTEEQPKLHNKCVLTFSVMFKDVLDRPSYDK